MTEKQKEMPIVPNRYVDFNGDPVEGSAWSWKKHIAKGFVVSTLLGAGAFMVTPISKDKIIYDAFFSMGYALGARVMQARNDKRKYSNKVIDTQPDPSQRTSLEDGVKMQETQLRNSIALLVDTSLLGCFNVLNVVRSSDPTFWVMGAIGDDAKRTLTARKVLKGDWVIVSRDEMKREAPAEEKKPEFAMGVQMRPIPVKPNLRITTPFTLGRE